MNSRRVEKLEKHMSRLISEVIQKEIGDDVLGGLVSITKTVMEPSLDTADVYISILVAEGNKPEEVFNRLTDKIVFIRKSIGKSLRLRTIPFITFRLDSTIEESQKVLSLIAKVNTKE